MSPTPRTDAFEAANKVISGMVSVQDARTLELELAAEKIRADEAVKAEKDVRQILDTYVGVEERAEKAEAANIALTQQVKELTTALEQWNSVLIEAAKISPERYLQAIKGHPELEKEPIVQKATAAAMSAIAAVGAPHG